MAGSRLLVIFNWDEVGVDDPARRDLLVLVLDRTEVGLDASAGGHVLVMVVVVVVVVVPAN